MDTEERGQRIADQTVHTTIVTEIGGLNGQLQEVNQRAWIEGERGLSMYWVKTDGALNIKLVWIQNNLMSKSFTLRSYRDGRFMKMMFPLCGHRTAFWEEISRYSQMLSQSHRRRLQLLRQSCLRSAIFILKDRHQIHHRVPRTLYTSSDAVFKKEDLCFASDDPVIQGFRSFVRTSNLLVGHEWEE